MPVRTTISCSAPASGEGAGTGGRAGLPWWGLVLPVLAFVTLLLLVTDPASGPEAGGAALLSRLAEMAGR
ncbi:hypothetical protein [Streptomyces chilikensis]|uniref:Uncharacterized protein n=1 Tax=Streptomyces chilikensis TaxID=1194079 RepID=A0ABV3EYR9_9ACTN